MISSDPDDADETVDRAQLETAWLVLTRETLPARAAERQLPQNGRPKKAWPVSADHCFMRIILDAVHRQRWDAVVKARPAYRHIDDDRLRAAVKLAQRIASGEADLWALNAQSLAWRGKQRIMTDNA